jgi:lipid A 3-O-deacylase
MFLDTMYKRLILTLGCTLAAWHGTCSAIDSTSLEFGTGNKTQMARVGAQWNWDKKWFQSNGNHLGGYWDLTAAEWRENRFQNIPGNTENIYDVGITPVFRFQNDQKLGFYGEAGIGAHYLSDRYNNNGRRFSTKFEFGDHIGVGYVFASKWEIGLKLQHFSNGGIKQPNSGANFAVLKAAYHF